MELPHHEEVRDETFDIDQDRAQCRRTVLGPDDGESGDGQRQAEEPENLFVPRIKWPIRKIEKQRERRDQQDDVEDGDGVDNRNAHGDPDRHRGCNERDHQKDAPLPDRITDLRSGRPRIDRPTSTPARGRSPSRKHPREAIGSCAFADLHTFDGPRQSSRAQSASL